MRCSATDGWFFDSGAAICGYKKHVGQRTLKVTLPAHRPVKRSTLGHILKQAELDVDKFLSLL